MNDRQQMGRIGRPVNGKVPAAFASQPQGAAARWCATVDGEVLLNLDGRPRRFRTSLDALNAAKDAASK